MAQKRSDRGNNPPKTTPPPDKAGPKRTDRIVPEAERVKVITKTEFIRVPVRSNKGYLSVVAMRDAAVSLTPVATDQKNAQAIMETIKDADGSLNLINLPPGKYKLLIEHADYQPFSEMIQVDPASPDTFVALTKMVSLFGAIRIGGLVAGAKVFLDDQPLRLTGPDAEIPKVPVGKHRLRVTKEGYADFSSEIDVLPGEASFVTARAEIAQVTVNLTAPAGARVYADSVEKTSVPADGKVALQLPQGKHTLRVARDGFLEWSKDYFLTLAAGPVNERVELIPLPSSSEAIWQPSEGARKWFPATTDWKFSANGALIRGDRPVLFDTESGRESNTYRDFKLEFDVVFSNNKGVAWIARAKDPNNYYLFEISSPQSNPTFHFYVCQNGKLEWKDSQRIVEKIDTKGDSFHITFEAKGNRFDTRLTIASAPSAKPHLIGIFQDSTFSYGGIGFRGKEQSEALLQTLFVIPL